MSVAAELVPDPERPPLWNPRTGIFDPAQLRLAIVMRGWTVVEFVKAAQVSRGCLYNALLGFGVTDRTAIRIFQALAKREPFELGL
jgi:predicted transcriptional regulator